MTQRGRKEGAATVEELCGAREATALGRPRLRVPSGEGGREGGKDWRREGAGRAGGGGHASAAAGAQPGALPSSRLSASHPLARECPEAILWVSPRRPTAQRGSSKSAGPRGRMKREGVKEGRFSGRWAEGGKWGGVGRGGDDSDWSRGCFRV